MKDSTRKSASGGQEAKTRRTPTDWDAVERDYRTGRFTKRELAEKHGISHTAINKRAIKFAWVQDLSERINQATQAKLAQQVRNEAKAKLEQFSVSTLVAKSVSDSFQNDVETIDLASDINAIVVSRHRKGLSEITDVRRQLLSQVAQAAANLPDLAEVIEMVRNPDENGVDKANDAMRKAMNRSSLIDDLKKLAEVDERVRKGEREAFGITTEAEENAARPTKRVVLDFQDVEARGG